MADNNNNLTIENFAEAIRQVVGEQIMRGGDSSYGQTAKQWGSNFGTGIAPYITGNPILQAGLGTIMGKMGGNIMSAQFPSGMTGGLNVGDSLYRQQLNEARDTQMDKSKRDIAAGLQATKESFAKNTYMQNGFLRQAGFALSGAGALGKQIDLESFGFQTTVMGSAGSEMTAAQEERNRNIKRRVFGDGGIINSLSQQYSADPSKFGINGKDVGLLANDYVSRGLVGDFGEKGGDNSAAMMKIQKAAKSISSIRDIIKGPLREVVAQMEQTFGNGYLNTFGEGGAANLVNKIRAVGQMSGFSPQQLMALAPSAKELVSAAGGNEANAMENVTLTGLIMGLTRGKDKQFVNEGHLTGQVLKTVVSAQQSKLGKNISSARSLADNKEDFDEKVEERIASGEPITLEFLSKTSKSSVGNIVGNRDSLRTKKSMHESNIGARGALSSQYNEATAKRRRAAEYILGGRDELDRIAKLNNMSSEELLWSSINDPDKIKGMDPGKGGQIEQAFSRYAKNAGDQNYMEQNRRLGDTKEALARDAKAKILGKVYEKTSYGGDFGMNMLKSLQQEKGNYAKVAKQMLNVMQPEDLKRMGDEAGLGKFIEGLDKQADELNMTDTERAEFFKKNMVKGMLFKGKDYFKDNEGYKEDVQAYKDDMSRIFDRKEEGSKSANELAADDIAAANKISKEKTGRGITESKKHELIRERQKGAILEEIKRKSKGLTGDKAKEMADLYTKFEGADSNTDLGALAHENEALLGGKKSLTSKFDSALGAAKDTAMTKMIDMLTEKIPEMAKALIDMGKFFGAIIDIIKNGASGITGIGTLFKKMKEGLFDN